MIEFEYDKTGVGRRLEMLRKRNNSSREKAAEDLDISKDSLYAYEKGKSIMSAEVLAKVCILFILQWTTYLMVVNQKTML